MRSGKKSPTVIGYNNKRWALSHCRAVGCRCTQHRSRGKALRYLTHYLYRGVISENDILVDSSGEVTFRYRESKTRQMRTQKLTAEAFLWKQLTHVLPRDFRRVRDYGFLHGNARLKLKRIQLLLQVRLKRKTAESKGMKCRECAHPMGIELVLPQSIPICFRFSPLAFAHEPMS